MLSHPVNFGTVFSNVPFQQKWRFILQNYSTTSEVLQLYAIVQRLFFAAQAFWLLLVQGAGQTSRSLRGQWRPSPSLNYRRMSSLIPRPVLRLEDIEGLEVAIGNNNKQGRRTSPSRPSSVPVEHRLLSPYHRHRADERGKQVDLVDGRGQGCFRGAQDERLLSVHLESPHRQRCDYFEKTYLAILLCCTIILLILLLYCLYYLLLSVVVVYVQVRMPRNP